MNHAANSQSVAGVALASENPATSSHPDETTPSLVVKDVSVKAGDRTLLKNVSFEARPGRVVGLIGPNGAGKSTLLSVISGDRTPLSGAVTIEGVDVAHANHKQLARLRAVMLQDVGVSFSFLVRDVVAMGAMPWAGTPYFDTREQAIDVALELVDVAHLADRDITTLSGGERARVALARILVQRCPVVLLDEPTAALDIAHQEHALNLARELSESGACVVVVLHDLAAAAAYCDDIVLLREGAVAASGTVEDVMTAENLSAAYGWPVDVLRSHHGSTVVTPQRMVQLIAQGNQKAFRDIAGDVSMPPTLSSHSSAERYLSPVKGQPRSNAPASALNRD